MPNGPFCPKVKQHCASSVLGWVTIWLGYSNPSIGTSFFSIQTYFKFSKIFNFDQNLKNLQFLPNFQISSTPKFEKSSNFYEMFKFSSILSKIWIIIIKFDQNFKNLQFLTKFEKSSILVKFFSNIWKILSSFQKSSIFTKIRKIFNFY